MHVQFVHAVGSMVLSGYNSTRSIMKTLASIMYTCSYMKSQPCNSNCSKITAVSVTYNVIIIKIHFRINFNFLKPQDLHM